MERLEDVSELSPGQVSAHDILLSGFNIPDGSVVPFPDRKIAEVRKGRLVIRMPAIEASPNCVSTCQQCVIGGCLPCASVCCVECTLTTA